MRALYWCAALAVLACCSGVRADDKKDDGTMPGFPDIKVDVGLLNVYDKGDVQVLKVIRGDYDEDKKEAFWLVELQSDIVKGSAEAKAIDAAWGSQEIGDGPEACFFDKNKVLVGSVKMMTEGRLIGGKKGDRIRLAVKADKADKLFTRAKAMEVRKPAS
jgi:hypothetical protein